MKPVDVFEFRLKMFLESRGIATLSSILLIPMEESVEVYDENVLIGIIRN